MLIPAAKSVSRLPALSRWRAGPQPVPTLLPLFLPKSGFSLSQLNLNDSTYCLRMPCSRSPSRCSIRFHKVSEIEPCFTQEILALHHQLLDPGTPVFKNIPGIAIRKRWRWKSINGALRIDVGLQKMRRRVVHLRHTNFSLVQITHNTKDNWRGPAEVEESS